MNFFPGPADFAASTAGANGGEQGAIRGIVMTAAPVSGKGSAATAFESLLTFPGTSEPATTFENLVSSLTSFTQEAAVSLQPAELAGLRPTGDLPTSRFPFDPDATTSPAQMVMTLQQTGEPTAATSDPLRVISLNPDQETELGLDANQATFTAIKRNGARRSAIISGNDNSDQERDSSLLTMGFWAPQTPPAWGRQLVNFQPVRMEEAGLRTPADTVETPRSLMDEEHTPATLFAAAAVNATVVKGKLSVTASERGAGLWASNARPAGASTNEAQVLIAEANRRASSTGAGWAVHQAESHEAHGRSEVHPGSNSATSPLAEAVPGVDGNSRKVISNEGRSREGLLGEDLSGEGISRESNSREGGRAEDLLRNGESKREVLIPGLPKPEAPKTSPNRLPQAADAKSFHLETPFTVGSQNQTRSPVPMTSATVSVPSNPALDEEIPVLGQSGRAASRHDGTAAEWNIASTSLAEAEMRSIPGEPMATSTTTPASAPAETPDLYSISEQIAIRLSGDEEIMTVQLDPKELGKLEIVVTQDGDGLSIVVHAHESSTAEFLQRQRDTLLEYLAEQGIEFNDLQFQSTGEEDQPAADDHNPNRLESVGTGSRRKSPAAPESTANPGQLNLKV